jgi:hypothetical protein
LTVTLSYSAAALRVRTVQEGTFMRQGGVDAVFTQQADPATGRVDITVTRTGDTSGASGAGLIAAVIFDAIAPGTATITPSGTGTATGGRPVSVQVAPVTITVR